MSEVIEINNIEELAQYRLLWNSLLPQTPGATFFLTLDWLETYWRHFGHDQKLRVLIVQAAGAPIGILSLCVRTEKYRLNKVRVLTYPLDNWSTWFGPIGPNPSTTMLAAMRHISRTPRDWDMIELRWVGPESSQINASVRAMRITGQFNEREEYQITSLVDLPATWDEFMAGKSHTLRRQFRRTLRETFDAGGGQFIRHRPAAATHGDGDPRFDLYDKCESIAQASWQATVVNGNTLTHDRVRDYFRDTHAVAARLGMLDVNLLEIEGRPAAFLYGYHYQGNVTALRTGYDANLANRGVGSALILKSLEDCIQRGDHCLDFGPGEREHKRRLRTRMEPTYRLTYTPLSSWRSQTVRLSRWAKHRWHRPPQAPASQPVSA